LKFQVELRFPQQYQFPLSRWGRKLKLHPSLGLFGFGVEADTTQGKPAVFSAAAGSLGPAMVNEAIIQGAGFALVPSLHQSSLLGRQLVAHAIHDAILQNDSMAVRKSQSRNPATSKVYGLNDPATRNEELR
jgi:hypothetical protein